MTQSPTNLVPRVSWPSDSFDCADSSYLALSKLSQSQETLGDEVDSPASFDSISLQQMVATPTHIYSG